MRAEGVTLLPGPDTRLLLVRMTHLSASEAARALLPVEVGGCTAQPALVMMVAPARFMASGTTAALDTLRETVETHFHDRTRLVLDVSGGWLAWRLAGPGVRRILQQFVSIDLDGAPLGVGRCAQTMAQHVRILIRREAHESYDLFVPRPFAAYWLDCLSSRLEVARAG
jgi:sarcosine oxidase subunit gamma